jgi:hypothetical protein
VQLRETTQYNAISPDSYDEEARQRANDEEARQYTNDEEAEQHTKDEENPQHTEDEEVLNDAISEFITKCS